jgi:hypothetical protein
MCFLFHKRKPKGVCDFNERMESDHLLVIKYNTYELESENIIIILLSYYIGFYRQIIITYEAYIW